MRSLAFVIAMLVCCAAAADETTSAREHYNRGTTLYNLSRFGEAAREYEAAYESKQDPALLFNIAQAHRLDGNSTKALLAFKAYLRSVPDTPYRAEVESRIVELQHHIQEDAAKTTKP